MIRRPPLNTVDALRETREYLAAQLQWAKENKLWAQADRYLGELDAVNLRISEEERLRK